MGRIEAVGLPSPRDCPGMVGVGVSLLGVAVSFALLVIYGGPIWSFALLVLFAFLGWTSFVWCAVWDESAPTIWGCPGAVGIVVGVVAGVVGVVLGLVLGAPIWSYLLVAASAVVVAGSLRWCHRRDVAVG